jgi:hypothetical protein
MSYIVNSTGYTAGALKNDNGVLQDLEILETMLAPTSIHGIDIMQDEVVVGADTDRKLSIGANVTNANGGLVDAPEEVIGASTHIIPILYKGIAYKILVSNV